MVDGGPLMVHDVAVTALMYADFNGGMVCCCKQIVSMISIKSVRCRGKGLLGGEGGGEFVHFCC